MDRARLREAMRERRAALPMGEQEAGSAALVRAVLAHPAWERAQAVAGFVGVRGEPDTRGLLEAALAGGKRLWLPRVMPGRRLEWVRVHDLDRQLVEGGFGLLEPLPQGDGVPRIEDAAVDLVLIPGLAFSSEGARIGFGGGYYDRALEGVAGADCPVRMGLCFSSVLDPPEAPIPVAPHDVPMHVVVTEQGIVDCTK